MTSTVYITFTVPEGVDFNKRIHDTLDAIDDSRFLSDDTSTWYAYIDLYYADENKRTATIKAISAPKNIGYIIVKLLDVNKNIAVEVRKGE